MKKKSISLKLIIKKHPTKICIVSISSKFSTIVSTEVLLEGNKYDFSVDYNAIDKSDILSIHRYLMAKNNI